MLEVFIIGIIALLIIIFEVKPQLAFEHKSLFAFSIIFICIGISLCIYELNRYSTSSPNQFISDIIVALTNKD